MSQKIDQDHRRFREIVRGKIKQNLRKYITQGEMLGKRGKELVSIPLPQIDIPHFRYGPKQSGGVGQGNGNPGDAIGQGEPKPGAGQAGDRPGDHLLEVEVTMEELAAILGEELKLPNIEPKGKERIIAKKDRYVGVRRTGPESLRHFRRTFKQALKRQISMGVYNPKDPLIVPIHDAMAKEVDRETFFRTRESGGTMISSAYKLCAKLIETEYPPSEWNVYPFHFSDGDNWSVDDTVTCIDLLKNQILPKVNLFAYGQVESPYGSGQFIKDLDEHFDEEDNLVTSEIKGKEAIMDSIRDFLGKGK